MDGAKRHTTSYRTELSGMLGALLALSSLLQQQHQRWDKLDGILWCDNKAAVKKFNDLEDDTLFSLTIANQPDADVLQELSRLGQRPPSSSRYKGGTPQQNSGQDSRRPTQYER